MNKNQLRIGNLVNEEVLGNVVISDICEHVVMVKVDSLKMKGYTTTYTLNYENIDPIPLTEKWLIYFGFIKEFNEDEGRDSFYVNNSDDSFYVHFDEEIADDFYIGATTYGYLKNTKYVHQLQNLYFSLTNNELQK